MPRFLRGLLPLVVLTVAGPCAADEKGLLGELRPLVEARSAWSRRPLVFEIKLSPWGSPSGLGGVGLAYSPIGWLSVSVGAGVGFQGFNQLEAVPQFDAMLRLRLLSARYDDKSVALYVGVGGSEGAYTTDTKRTFELPIDGETPPPVRSWDHAWWGNVELGANAQWKTGVSLRVYLGNGWNLSRGSGQCVASGGQSTRLGDCGDQGHTFAYVGAALGYAFPP